MFPFLNFSRIVAIQDSGVDLDSVVVITFTRWHHHSFTPIVAVPLLVDWDMPAGPGWVAVRPLVVVEGSILVAEGNTPVGVAGHLVAVHHLEVVGTDNLVVEGSNPVVVVVGHLEVEHRLGVEGNNPVGEGNSPGAVGNSLGVVDSNLQQQNTNV